MDTTDKNNPGNKNEQANPEKGYNPTDRDFQRTEGDVDSISESEKELPDNAKEHANYNKTNRDFQRTEQQADEISTSEEQENERTATANTKPDKDKIN